LPDASDPVTAVLGVCPDDPDALDGGLAAASVDALLDYALHLLGEDLCAPGAVRWEPDHARRRGPLTDGRRQEERRRLRGAEVRQEARHRVRLERREEGLDSVIVLEEARCRDGSEGHRAVVLDYDLTGAATGDDGLGDAEDGSHVRTRP